MAYWPLLNGNSKGMGLKMKNLLWGRYGYILELQCFAMPIHTCMESVSAVLAIKEHIVSIRSNSQCLELIVYKPVFNSHIVKWIKEWRYM